MVLVRIQLETSRMSVSLGGVYCKCMVGDWKVFLSRKNIRAKPAKLKSGYSEKRDAINISEKSCTKKVPCKV